MEMRKRYSEPLLEVVNIFPEEAMLATPSKTSYDGNDDNPITI